MTDKRELRSITKKNCEIEQKMTTEAGPSGHSPTFDIKTATAILSPYDGSPENLEAFLDGLSLLKDLIPENQTATAIKFIKTKVTGKARIAFQENPTTISEIAEAMKKEYQIKQAELTQQTQK